MKARDKEEAMKAQDKKNRKGNGVGVTIDLNSIVSAGCAMMEQVRKNVDIASGILMPDMGGSPSTTEIDVDVKELAKELLKKSLKYLSDMTPASPPASNGAC